VTPVPTAKFTFAFQPTLLEVISSDLNAGLSLFQDMEQSNLQVGRKFFLIRWTRWTGIEREIEELRALAQ
jgi:hypothetical protein